MIKGRRFVLVGVMLTGIGTSVGLKMLDRAAGKARKDGFFDRQLDHPVMGPIIKTVGVICLVVVVSYTALLVILS